MFGWSCVSLRKQGKGLETLQAKAAAPPLLRCKTSSVLFGLHFGAVAFLCRGFVGHVGVTCVDTAVPAFSVVFLAEYCTSL